MSDRELLELAAKAAGFLVEWREWTTGRVAEFKTIKYTKHEGYWVNGVPWNPLTDDGDALRLAVKLSIDMSFNFENAVFVYADEVMETLNRNGNDLCAASRRAIVRAAAEIGRQMQEGEAA